MRYWWCGVKTCNKPTGSGTTRATSLNESFLNSFGKRRIGRFWFQRLLSSKRRASPRIWPRQIRISKRRFMKCASAVSACAPWRGCWRHAKALYRQENAAFRDIARRLSPLRDAHVQLATFDELVTHADNAERFAHLRNRVVESNHHNDKKLVEEQLSATINEVHAAQERFRNAIIPNESAFELIRPGLLFTYKQGRREMSSTKCVQPQAAAFHEGASGEGSWLSNANPARRLAGSAKRMRSEVDKLGDLLGKEHDLAVLRHSPKTRRWQPPRGFSGFPVTSGTQGLGASSGSGRQWGGASTLKSQETF